MRIPKLLGWLLIFAPWMAIPGTSAQTPAACQVPMSHQSIQEAIDDLQCNTILIPQGSYAESLYIDRGGLILRGEGRNLVMVNGKSTNEPVVFLTDKAQNVELKELTLTGGKHGLQALGSKNLRLFNLILDNNVDTGLFLVGVGSGELFNSKVTGNGTGVFLADRTAFRLTDNLIEGNVQCGLQAAEQSAATGANNTIFGNGGGVLCGSVAGQQGLLDQLPPEAPRDVVRRTPASWTNQANFRVVIDWINPEDKGRLAAFWFNMKRVPTHPTDGTRMLIEQKPLTTTLENQTDSYETLVYVWLEDKMGNVTHKNRASVPLLIDLTDPEVQQDPNRPPSPPANVNGWNNTDVTVFFECHDQGSGIRGCTESVVETKEGRNLSVVGRASDNAGNSADPASVGVNIDKGAPNIGSFRINGGANRTASMNVDLSLEFNDQVDLSSRQGNQCTFEIRFANVEGTWENWKLVTATAEPSRPGQPPNPCEYDERRPLPEPRNNCLAEPREEKKGVMVQARDRAWNEADTIIDTILLSCDAQVPGDFSTLQDAIDNVPDNATILLGNPTYTENLTINKSLTLRSMGKEKTTIKGQVEGQPVILIGSGTVLIENVVITKRDVVSAETFKEDGIQIRGGATVTLTDVQILSNGGDGLEVGDSARVELNNTRVSGNGNDGLGVGGSATVTLSDTQVFANGNDGLGVGGSATVTLSGTQISANGDDGLEVGGSATANLADVIIESNGIHPRCSELETICNGIEMWNQALAVIENSVIRNNLDWGIAAHLLKCGYPTDLFTGSLDLQGLDTITGNGAGDVCVP